MSLGEECQLAVAADEADVRLNRLMDAVWRFDLEDQPEMATYYGIDGDHHRWTDHSGPAHAARTRDGGAPLQALRQIDRRQLSEPNQLNFDLFHRIASSRAEATAFPAHLLPVSQMGGPHQRTASVLAMMPVATAAQRKAVRARLAAIPQLVDQTIELLREGTRAGVTQPAVVLRDVPDQVAALDGPPRSSPLLACFGEGSDLEAEDIVRRLVNPAWERLHNFLAEEYLPGARLDISCQSLPEGAAWYRHLVRRHTTTDMSPDEIHALGHDEVKRIRQSMDEVIAGSGFDGTFAEFCTMLRSDSRFYFGSADELLARYRDICKRIDPGLASLFGTLPRLPYGVKVIPPHAEKSQTTAYYQPGSPEAGRPGWFFANTYDLSSRPSWEMEALSLHEAVPGHHLQIALAQEMDHVPEFRRRWGAYTAYVEGWGLYAESLGQDLGLYTDPFSRFGQLSYEMWRAVRLVVDTGMHAKGWTRDQAIEFFQQNSSKPIHDIVVEIDRYIAWPGQALAYKIGERTIVGLRSEAEAALGDQFDVRQFHDAVLEAGPLPLDVLQERMRAWMTARH